MLIELGFERGVDKGLLTKKRFGKSRRSPPQNLNLSQSVLFFLRMKRLRVFPPQMGEAFRGHRFALDLIQLDHNTARTGVNFLESLQSAAKFFAQTAGRNDKFG
ncbi:MAG: hypothetical protein JW384_00670 [Nitrosomonadaceae bacterium]|nr:hypothetical protein [Nitrosomonadaceae bacterium]